MPKSATAVDPMVKPDPNLEKRIRRVFTGGYKLSIIQQADACKHGELGALLRREKLYAGQLLQWRREIFFIHSSSFVSVSVIAETNCSFCLGDI